MMKLVPLIIAVFALTACDQKQEAASLAWDDCLREGDERIAAFIQFMPREELREEWAKTNGGERVGHKQIEAFAQFSNDQIGKFVMIYMPVPEHTRDLKFVETVCHELRHGFEGHWHDDAGKEYHP